MGHHKQYTNEQYKSTNNTNGYNNQWAAVQYQLIHKQYQWMGNIVPMGYTTIKYQ